MSRNNSDPVSELEIQQVLNARPDFETDLFSKPQGKFLQMMTDKKLDWL